MPFLAWLLSEGHLLESRLLATVVAEADALNQTPRSPPVPHPYLKLPGPAGQQFSENLRAQASQHERIKDV